MWTFLTTFRSTRQLCDFTYRLLVTCFCCIHLSIGIWCSTNTLFTDFTALFFNSHDKCQLSIISFEFSKQIFRLIQYKLRGTFKFNPIYTWNGRHFVPYFSVNRTRQLNRMMQHVIERIRRSVNALYTHEAVHIRSRESFLSFIRLFFFYGPFSFVQVTE